MAHALLVVLHDGFLGVLELLGRDAVGVHQLLFVDAHGAEPASSDGGDGQGHDLQLVFVRLATEFGVLLATCATDGRLGAFEAAAFAGRQGLARGFLRASELASSSTGQWFNRLGHVSAKHVAERGHELGVHRVGVALGTSVQLTDSGSEAALLGRQAVASTVKLVAEGVHLAPHFGTTVACFHVHGLVVAAFAKRAAAVGVSIVVNDGVYQGAHVADALCSGQINRQVSAAFVAFRDHFSQLQGICLATPYKGFNFQHLCFLMSPRGLKKRIPTRLEKQDIFLLRHTLYETNANMPAKTRFESPTRSCNENQGNRPI